MKLPSPWLMVTKRRCNWIVLFILLTGAQRVHAQRARGELLIEVYDPRGAALSAAAELVSDANQFRRNFQTSQDGRYVVQDLPFGIYRLSLNAKGFAPWIDI